MTPRPLRRAAQQVRVRAAEERSRTRHQSVHGALGPTKANLRYVLSMCLCVMHSSPVHFLTKQNYLVPTATGTVFKYEYNYKYVGT